MVLLLDNYDSFTYNLKDYLEQCGVEVAVHRCDELTLEEVETLLPQGIVLSPGPGKPGDKGIMMPLIERFYQRVPLLGICLGHQAIARFFGAEIIHADRPMHGKISVLELQQQSQQFSTIKPSATVMRYHSLIVEEPLPKALLATARTVEGELMAFVHTQYPVWALQFHPESVLTTDGLQMVRNWVNLLKK